MRSPHPFLLALAMLIPAAGSAQTKCPWLNEATARGILGGDVTMTVDTTARGDGVCKFSRQQKTAVFELRISIAKMNDVAKQFSALLAQCPPKSPPLPAIGNEAVTCAVEGKDGQYAEKVVGRVRETAFIISVSSSIQEDLQMTKQMLRNKAILIAEQVAGILF